jgi:hypothetical protein
VAGVICKKRTISDQQLKDKPGKQADNIDYVPVSYDDKGRI